MLKKAFRNLLILSSLFFVFETEAQDLMKRHYIGASLKTNGVGINYSQTRFSTNSKWHRTYSGSISTLKHPKEIKIINPQASNPKPYVFGKLNKVGLVNMSPGIRYEAIPRHKNNHLGLSFLIDAGPQVAVLKPIYLRISYNNQQNDGVFIANEKYDPDAHTDQSMIEGYSRSKFGWSELTYQMGIQTKAAVQVEWGKDQLASKMVIIGSQFDVFFKEVPIMANKQQSQTFGAFYVQFMWGFIKL